MGELSAFKQFFAYMMAIVWLLKFRKILLTRPPAVKHYFKSSFTLQIKGIKISYLQQFCLVVSSLHIDIFLKWQNLTCSFLWVLFNETKPMVLSLGTLSVIKSGFFRQIFSKHCFWFCWNHDFFPLGFEFCPWFIAKFI